MKKTILFCFFLITTISLFSQVVADEFIPHWYAGAEGGYGFPAMQRSIGETTDRIDSVTFQDNAVIHSFGEGFNEGIYGGYNFHPNVSVEMGFSYLNARQFEVVVGTTNPSSFYRYTPRSIRCYLGVKVGYERPKYYAYLRMAFLAGRQSMDCYGNIIYGIAGSIGMTKYDPGNSFGIRSSGGVSFHVFREFSVFTEATFFGLNWSPASSKITTAPAGSSVSSTNTIYVDQVPNFYSPNAPYDPNDPGKWLKFYWPFSSFGFNVGVQMNFGYRHKKTDR